MIGLLLGLIALLCIALICGFSLLLGILIVECLEVFD